MSEQARRAAELLCFLEAQHVRYAVVGSAREDLGRTDEDIDLLVEPDALATLAGPIAQFCRDTGGWLVNAIDHQANACCFVCAWLDAAGHSCSLQLDFSGGLRRRGKLLLPAHALLGKRQRAPGSPATGGGCYIAAPADAVIYSLLKGLTKPVLPDADAARLSREWREDPRGARERISELWSSPDVELLASAADRNRWDAVRARQPSLRRSLLARRPRIPNHLALETVRVARRVTRPTGLVVALLGPDGSGKSTALERIAPTLAPLFRRVELHHFRPDPFGLGLPAAPGSGKPPRHAPGWSLVSLAKLAYYLFDYWVGYAWNVWPRSVRTGLVVFDRYFHDLAIDPVRLRHRGPMALARKLERLIPGPDLFILMHAPTSTMQARKQEVPPAETERQRAEYLKLARRLPHGHVVDATRPVDEVTAEVLQIVLAHLAGRTARRLGISLALAASERATPVADADKYAIAAAARPNVIQSERN